MKITEIRIPIVRCIEGVYLRWWWNGWNYFLFSNGYEINMNTTDQDVQVSQLFSVISKIERATKIDADYTYKITLEGISEGDIPGFNGLLLAEKVEQYEGGLWYEIDIVRGDHIIKDEGTRAYVLDFDIKRKELPLTPSVYQKSLKLYIGSVLCDLNDDEVVPINKQTNDIAEMQDRQSDFTATFKIRKTRLMRSLFELSGEVGANTLFPYQKQTCKLIQDNIEMITNGTIILDRVDDEYYYVSIYSGNLDFFKQIENKKLSDLLPLESPDPLTHNWNLTDIAASHASDLDYLYPLMEPSDDGGICQLNPGTEKVNMYGGWIWPFAKAKRLWDEIFTNAEYYCEGEILTNDTFLKMFMPIQSLTCTNTKKYLYSAWWTGYNSAGTNNRLGFTGAVLINGDLNFQNGLYDCRFTATYKIQVIVAVGNMPPQLSLYNKGTLIGDMPVYRYTLVGAIYEMDYSGTAGDQIYILTTANIYYYYSIIITEIKDAKIGFSAPVEMRNYLPDMSQTDFVKMICNQFGLIPETTPRDHRIVFWNYLDLYKNIPRARNWSNYLSEREDETEFKFGDYAQNNYLKYRDSEDVIKDNGEGILKIEDTTLQTEKDILTLPVSTCDEVSLETMMPYNVSRINFNKFNPSTNVYDQNDKIDPRIVYVETIADTSPPIKTFSVRDNVTFGAGSTIDIENPKKASSLQVSFSYLINNYAGLSRMLTKTNLRRAKFNLPVYEVAGLKHYIPIYLSQYKAYFYVNKINNYIPGKLCIIDLIKL